MKVEVKFNGHHKKLARLSEKKLSVLNHKAEGLLRRAARIGSQKQLDRAMELHQSIEYARLYKVRKEGR